MAGEPSPDLPLKAASLSSPWEGEETKNAPGVPRNAPSKTATVVPSPSQGEDSFIASAVKQVRV